MAPIHGIGACLSGWRIFNRSTDCNRIGFNAVEAPFGGIGVVDFPKVLLVVLPNV